MNYSNPAWKKYKRGLNLLHHFGTESVKLTPLFTEMMQSDKMLTKEKCQILNNKISSFLTPLQGGALRAYIGRENAPKWPSVDKLQGRCGGQEQEKITS